MYVAALREEADIADERAVDEGNAAQDHFERRVSDWIEEWTRVVLAVAGSDDNEARPLGIVTVGNNSSVVNTAAFRRLSYILGLGDPTPTRDKFPSNDPDRVFTAEPEGNLLSLMWKYLMMY